MSAQQLCYRSYGVNDRTCYKKKGHRGRHGPGYPEKSVVLKIEISWSRRKAKVTSLTGGHMATCLDLGDKMEIQIAALHREAKP